MVVVCQAVSSSPPTLGRFVQLSDRDRRPSPRKRRRSTCPRFRCSSAGMKRRIDHKPRRVTQPSMGIRRHQIGKDQPQVAVDDCELIQNLTQTAEKNMRWPSVTPKQRISGKKGKQPIPKQSRLDRQMSEVISLREKVAQAELVARQSVRRMEIHRR
jgi:hypothetical protein